MHDAAQLIARLHRAITEHEREYGTRRTEPIELTREQYENFKAGAAMLYPAEGAPSAFYGVPIVIKD